MIFKTKKEQDKFYAPPDLDKIKQYNTQKQRESRQRFRANGYDYITASMYLPLAIVKKLEQFLKKNKTITLSSIYQNALISGNYTSISISRAEKRELKRKSAQVRLPAFLLNEIKNEIDRTEGISKCGIFQSAIINFIKEKGIA